MLPLPAPWDVPNDIAYTYRGYTLDICYVYQPYRVAQEMGRSLLQELLDRSQGSFVLGPSRWEHGRYVSKLDTAVWGFV